MKHIEMTVRGYHIDAFGHVNNARYLEFLEDARWAIFNDALAKLPQLELSLAIVNININYRRAALLGQKLHIDATLTQFGKTSFVITQKVVDTDNSDIIFADATITSVIIKDGKPLLLNDELRQLLNVN